MAVSVGAQITDAYSNIGHIYKVHTSVTMSVSQWLNWWWAVLQVSLRNAFTPLALWVTASVWSPYERLRSIMTPRYFTLDTWWII